MSWSMDLSWASPEDSSFINELHVCVLQGLVQIRKQAGDLYEQQNEKQRDH
jgi:hypothetical protein